MRHCVIYSLAVLLLVFTRTAFAETHNLAVAPAADRMVQVDDIRVEGNTVHGVIANKSPQTLRDVRLVIRHAWLWKDERNPGSDNPSRSEFYSFAGEIPGGRSAPFTYRLKDMPRARQDGKFETSAEVMSYTLVSQ